MKAITIQPGQRGSVRFEEVDEPPLTDGSLLAKTLSLGVCGTDEEILEGHYGSAHSAGSRIILGHEALARVVDCPSSSGWKKGDLFVPIVRRPDPVPCPNCAADEWDMCSNGGYTERGIKGKNGFASEYFRIEPEFAVKVPFELGLLGVLAEPTSVVAKAWDHIDSIAARAKWYPQKVLITGAGPVGLLAALIAKQKGWDVHVLDREEEGIKPQLVKDLGGTYHVGPVQEVGRDVDVIVECTGAASVIIQVINLPIPNCVKCLVGVAATEKTFPLDVGLLTRNMVLDNEVIFGSVNANREHYYSAVRALSIAPRSWVERLITRQVSLENWSEALHKKMGDIKSVILFE